MLLVLPLILLHEEYHGINIVYIVQNPLQLYECLNAFWVQKIITGRSNVSKPRLLGVDARLEGEPAATGVANFVQVGVAGELDHRWRPAHQDERVVAGRRQMFPHHVFIDETLAIFPI